MLSRQCKQLGQQWSWLGFVTLQFEVSSAVDNMHFCLQSTDPLFCFSLYSNSVMKSCTMLSELLWLGAWEGWEIAAQPGWMVDHEDVSSYGNTFSFAYWYCRTEGFQVCLEVSAVQQLNCRCLTRSVSIFPVNLRRVRFLPHSCSTQDKVLQVMWPLGSNITLLTQSVLDASL